MNPKIQPHNLLPSTKTETDMALPQDISPINNEVMDSIARTGEMDWVEYSPGSAYLKVLWVGAETGRWAVLLRWKKGHVAPPHKHLTAAHTYILSGRLRLRDEVVETGDYIYEANGMIHDETVAEEDTELLFICDGSILYFDEDHFTGYFGWEQVKRIAEGQEA
jgi:quercetin dioxygenase-like cupin family protein